MRTHTRVRARTQTHRRYAESSLKVVFSLGVVTLSLNSLYTVRLTGCATLIREGQVKNVRTKSWLFTPLAPWLCFVMFRQTFSLEKPGSGFGDTV